MEPNEQYCVCVCVPIQIICIFRLLEKLTNKNITLTNKNITLRQNQQDNEITKKERE
jgi:hypothetical protein